MADSDYTEEISAEEAAASAIYHAVAANDIEKVKRLIAEGNDVNYTNDYISPPIVKACLLGNNEMIEVLVNSKADLEAIDSYNRTPLIAAIQKDNFELVKQLIEYGAGIESCTEHGDTPLMIAAQYGNIDTVKFLLKCGANPNAQNNDDATACDFAEGNRRVLNILLKYTK